VADDLPPIDAALAALDWGDLSVRLTNYALYKLRRTSRQAAEDCAQQAIAEFLDPAYAAWDRERHPDAFDCLGSIVNGIVANHFRREARRGKRVALREDARTHDDEEAELPVDEDNGRRAKPDEADEGPPPDAVHPTDARTPEDLLRAASIEASRLDVAMAKLRARIHGDALCLALLERMRAGDARAAADAEALGVTISEMYTARQRLMRHARAVARDLAAGGDS
jgi:hypothetical protein